jgi:predicted nucleotidyltransferase component of viral defense system
MKELYRKQVALLLQILPEIAMVKNFALHGGTAINLFELNMPRLSIDIDLTFIEIGERQADLQTIKQNLEQLKIRIKKQNPSIVFSDPLVASEHLKINCSTKDANVKIEVNQINRGIIAPLRIMTLCEKAQVDFDSFCEVSVVSKQQLWGGKIIAALDRQHPRDLFDIRNLLTGNGITTEIKNGLIFFMLCSKRPIHELLSPQIIDQQTILNSQFNGMTDESFTKEHYNSTRAELLKAIHSNLTTEDKNFLLKFTKAEPEWRKFDYNIYPAIKWKLLNLKNLKSTNPQKFNEQIALLEETLG